jgi:hypothetical protein
VRNVSRLDILELGRRWFSGVFREHVVFRHVTILIDHIV